MESQINKTPQSFWKERDGIMMNQNQVKPMNRLKSPKKQLDGKKTKDVKIEDVFLNSEYFKYQSGNMSSLSFCSGDNGENQWTVDPKFGISYRPKTNRLTSHPSDAIKSDTAVMEKEKECKQWAARLKRQSCHPKENPQEKTEKILEGILSGKERLDRDLITLITEQMFLAERELQITRTHLIETISKLNERDLEIIQLHEKIQNVQKSKKTGTSNVDVTESPSKSSEDYRRLITASEKLKKQVKDMEEFLNDYGLVWVGDKDANQKPDFDKIVSSFQRLNSIASQPKIIQTTLGAKFELPREIPIVLYSNGLLIRNDFREYNKISTTIFLQDIEDGYFPSELQIEFPDGVPFEVFDKRNEVYNKNGKIPIFQGNGNRLGSTFEGKPTSVVYLEPLKQIRNHDSNSTLDRSLLRRVHKKPSRTVSLQVDKNPILKCVSRKLTLEPEGKEEAKTVQGPLLRVKIRYGREKTESFVLQIEENEKMLEFQKCLQQKLCERYHNECIVDVDSNNRYTDFEIHVYGRAPFRLSDQLYLYPRECGIVDNCVINVTEI